MIGQSLELYSDWLGSNVSNLAIRIVGFFWLAERMSHVIGRQIHMSNWSTLAGLHSCLGSVLCLL
jgi:hypothetical protein